MSTHRFPAVSTDVRGRGWYNRRDCMRSTAGPCTPATVASDTRDYEAMRERTRHAMHWADTPAAYWLRGHGRVFA